MYFLTHPILWNLLIHWDCKEIEPIVEQEKFLPTMMQQQGGHAYSRHGAHTTMPDQERRATTGVPPDNPCKVPKSHGPDSTRFLSNADQLDAIQRGKVAMSSSGQNSVTFDMGRTIGEGYRSGGGCPVTTSRVTVRRNSSGEIYTAYPQL